MFIYTIQDPNSLLSHITLNGQYLTFWQRKNYGRELSIFQRQQESLLTPLAMADDPRHNLFHRDLHLSEEHLHCMVRIPMTKQVFNAIIEQLAAASTIEGRNESYVALCNLMEAKRIEKGDAVLPEYDQRNIELFDRTTPIIPIAECNAIKNAFANYVQDRNQPSHVLNELHERLIQVYIEWVTSAWIKKATNTPKFMKFDHKIETIDLLFKSVNVFTNSLVLSALINLLAELETDPLLDEMDDLLTSEQAPYPISTFKEIIKELKQALMQVKAILQPTWYKRIGNVIASGLGLVLGKSLGFGMPAVASLAALGWIGGDALSRKRDWYSYDSYRQLQQTVDQLTPQEQASAQLGLEGRTFTTLFNLAAWKHPRPYYGAMTARIIGDIPLSEAVIAKAR